MAPEQPERPEAQLTRVNRPALDLLTGAIRIGYSLEDRTTILGRIIDDLIEDMRKAETPKEPGQRP